MNAEVWTGSTHGHKPRHDHRHAPDASALILTTLRSSTAAALKRTRRPPAAVAATSSGRDGEPLLAAGQRNRPAACPVGAKAVRGVHLQVCALVRFLIRGQFVHPSP